MSKNIPQYDASHYAVVDLGSNSFHLSISRLVNEQAIKVNKVKRKVRLAAGLDTQLMLSEQAIANGLDCLRLFAQHLASIPTNNIIIVATATLRIAKNSAEFLTHANNILSVQVKVLSGEQEANTIYQGVAHTCQNNHDDKRLVIDIGGASTELIIGQGFTANKAVSINVGCVTYKTQFFTNGKLTNQNFNAAIAAATLAFKPISEDFITRGWQTVLGSSGTIQALVEILAHRQQEIRINSPFLLEIKQALIQCNTIEQITLDGLRAERAPVIASGLSILIALFNCLHITTLELSTGALREGLLFELLSGKPTD